MKQLRVLWLVLVVWAPAGAVNLLNNGGFEEGDPPAGWLLVPQDAFCVDDLVRYEGRRSLRFSSLSPLQEGPWLIYSRMAVPPGNMLQVGGMLRSASFRGTVEALLFQPNPFTGDLQIAGRRTLLASASLQSSEWRSFSFFVSPARGGGMAMLTLTFQGTGQVWVDALTVAPISPNAWVEEPFHGVPACTPFEALRTTDAPDEAAFPLRPPIPVLPPTLAPTEPSGENLLRDSGFESGGIATPWRKFWNPKRAFGVVCLFDRSEAYEGRASALVTNLKPFAADPAGWCQEVNRVVPGSTLLLTGAIRTRAVRGNAYLRLECWGHRTLLNGEGDAKEEVLASATTEAWWLSDDTPWTPVSISLRAPEGTTKVIVFCTLSGRGAAWFDAVRLLGPAIR